MSSPSGTLSKGPIEPAVSGPDFRLNGRQRGALAAICDTFVPGGDGLPAASALEVPQAVVEAIAMNPRESERRQVAMLLGLWDTRVMTALGGGRGRRFSSLSQAERERVLLSWCDSRLPQRRAVFHALRKAALLMYYLAAGPQPDRSRVWQEIGYPGPLGPNPDAPPKSITPLTLDRDIDLDCDVCVVGSGAGGGTAAGVLAAAGLDVLVLEAGDYYDDADFDGDEAGGYRRMYLNGGGAATHDQSLGLLAGSCLGGGTVVNWTTSFPTPDHVREEWAAHGVPAFAGTEYEQSLNAVLERLEVNDEHSRPSARDARMQRGLEELGWHVGRMHRNVRGCDQGENCGYCGYGCRLGAKRSTVKTWLSDAHAAGTRIAVRTRAESIVVEGGTARGVEARTTDGHRVSVRARAVVAAAGAINTPALLKRSGLDNRQIGRNLKLHPASGAFGVFDEDLEPWTGTLQAVYSDEHRDLRDGYGVIYEGAAGHPSLVVSYAPWRGASHHRDLMKDLRRTVPVAALLRDRDGGEVRVGRDGYPIVRYHLSPFDAEHLRIGIDGVARILEAAGARRIFSAQARWVSYEAGEPGGLERFTREIAAAGFGPGQVNLSSFHIMGSARMGGSPESSACSPTGESWDARNLVVCDASAFPTASGVNPMVSIEATAHMNASALAARMT